jgi:ATP-dependent RNA helicase DeaD
VRPADVVGAIANEAGVPGREIGAIDIYDRFSLVDVPARYQRQIIEKMSGATLRGRSLEIKIAGRDQAAREREPERPRRTPARSDRPGRPGAPRAPWKKRPR